MKAIILAMIIAAPGVLFAQVQSKSQCATTVRARSLSISSAEAEKLCADDYIEVVNCAVTASQMGSAGTMEDRLKTCRGQWAVQSLRPTPTPSPSPSPSSSSSVAPAAAKSSDEGEEVSKVKVPVGKFEEILGDDDAESSKGK